MCVVFRVGDFYRDLCKPRPWYNDTTIVVSEVPREEFDELKKQVTEMKELLRRANGEPECEMDEMGGKDGSGSGEIGGARTGTDAAGPNGQGGKGSPG